jgi:hypothetical protein
MTEGDGPKFEILRGGKGETPPSDKEEGPESQADARKELFDFIHAARGYWQANPTSAVEWEIRVNHHGTEDRWPIRPSPEGALRARQIAEMVRQVGGEATVTSFDLEEHLDWLKSLKKREDAFTEADPPSVERETLETEFKNRWAEWGCTPDEAGWKVVGEDWEGTSVFIPVYAGEESEWRARRLAAILQKLGGRAEVKEYS